MSFDPLTINSRVLFFKASYSETFCGLEGCYIITKSFIVLKNGLFLYVSIYFSIYYIKGEGVSSAINQFECIYVCSSFKKKNNQFFFKYIFFIREYVSCKSKFIRGWTLNSLKNSWVRFSYFCFCRCPYHQLWPSFNLKSYKCRHRKYFVGQKF